MPFLFQWIAFLYREGGKKKTNIELKSEIIWTTFSEAIWLWNSITFSDEPCIYIDMHVKKKIYFK